MPQSNGCGELRFPRPLINPLPKCHLSGEYTLGLAYLSALSSSREAKDPVVHKRRRPTGFFALLKNAKP